MLQTFTTLFTKKGKTYSDFIMGYSKEFLYLLNCSLFPSCYLLRYAENWI